MDQNGNSVIIGNKTESPLLNFAWQLGWDDFKQTRNSANVVQMMPFSSERKAMGVVVELRNNGWRLYVKGASEILTKLCQHHVVVRQDGNHGVSEDGEVENALIAVVESDNTSRTIIFFSDIILMDNFASIVKAIAWGRCVNDAVRKFLQFRESTIVTVTFVTSLSSAQESTALNAVMTAVQSLWVNIIMDTFAALALATELASDKLLECKLDKKTAPLFSVDMYKQIFFQSAYQIAITVSLFRS